MSLSFGSSSVSARDCGICGGGAGVGAETLDDPKLDDILGCVPGALVTDIRGGK